MAPCQPLLDPFLTLAQPVEHVQHLVAPNRPGAEQGAEGVPGGFGAELSGTGQLGGRREDAQDDGRQGQIPLSRGAAVEQARQTEPAADAENRGNMAVRQGASDREEGIDARVDDGTLEQGAQGVDELRRHSGEIGQGFSTDPLAFPPSLSEQDGGLVGLVGDDIDVIGHGQCYGNTMLSG